MKQIPLTQGNFALVDDENFERVIQFKWHLANHKGKLYATRNINIVAKGKQRQSRLLLHRFIINAPKGLQVDHKDGNGLNNQKSNLRLCTNAQNQYNRPKFGFKMTSIYKGVRVRPLRKAYEARITKDKHTYYLGVFSNEIDAAKAYDLKAKELHGEFAYLNFSDKQEKKA